MPSPRTISNLPWQLKASDASLAGDNSIPQAGVTLRLTAAMAGHDEEAYRQFFALYFNRLLRYLLVVTKGDEELAREALQLTFIRIIRYIKPFESEEKFWSWLTVLARSAWLDEQRKRQRQWSILGRIFQWNRSSGIDASIPCENRFLPALARSLALLDEEERGLIQAKYFEARSVREIAGSGSEKAVESRLGRIRKKLKQNILAHLKYEDRS